MKEKNEEEKVITSKELNRELNEERAEKGLDEIPEINNAAGANTGNLARKDKSWKNAGDFFKQMLKDKRDK